MCLELRPPKGQGCGVSRKSQGAPIRTRPSLLQAVPFPAFSRAGCVQGQLPASRLGSSSFCSQVGSGACCFHQDLDKGRVWPSEPFALG